MEAGSPPLHGGGLVRSIRLAWTFIKLTAQYEMQYRLNFFVQLVQSALQLITGIVAITIVFTYTTDLGGWGRGELLVVLGIHMLLGGIMRAIIQPNMMQTIREVDEGTFDYPLVKPADSQLLTSLRTFQIWQLTDVLLGGGVVIWGLNELGGGISVPNLAIGGLLVACGAAIIYFVWIALTASAFKLIKVGRMGDLFNGTFEAGRWPITIYPAAMRLALSYVVPLGFAITVPAQTLANRVDPVAIATTVAITAAFGWLSRQIWKAGINSYTSASS